MLQAKRTTSLLCPHRTAARVAYPLPHFRQYFHYFISRLEWQVWGRRPLSLVFSIPIFYLPSGAAAAAGAAGGDALRRSHILHANDGAHTSAAGAIKAGRKGAGRAGEVRRGGGHGHGQRRRNGNRVRLPRFRLL